MRTCIAELFLDSTGFELLGVIRDWESLAVFKSKKAYPRVEAYFIFSMRTWIEKYETV